MTDSATVSRRGAARWRRGHPWIYRSDVVDAPERAGIVAVREASGPPLGSALFSPTSEIRLRYLAPPAQRVDRAWWTRRIASARDRRGAIDANAWRVVHAEGDGLPSLVVDRYDRWLVAQLLSAGLEACREDVLDALEEVLEPAGILLRNDVPVRRHENLPRTVESVRGEVPEWIEIREGAVRTLVAPREGQKTGAFLDQREHRRLAGSLARGRALDVFSYEGGFALHMATEASDVVAVDQSADALARGRENAGRNGLRDIAFVEANAFDFLRAADEAGEPFDVIVLDPPAFAKGKRHVERALAGYKEVNLRALRLLAPGGHLLTFSCSYHVGRDRFLAMLADAAADAGRPVRLDRVLGPPVDHPELLTVPESGYLKGALLQARGRLEGEAVRSVF